MKADLLEIRRQWYGCHLVRTAFVPQRVWRGVQKSGAIERARKKINKEMKSFCAANGITFLEHVDLRFKAREFFRGGGVHLSFMGMELYLLQVKEVLKAMFREK
ncbi:hypothetical protein NDU88_006013 [Pleurodeles waltl]|uniref:Uncharacterized protein n=1 Tax=Pleurodeles waltl TaxID=8319 RepID=A0AAV7TZ16_PLEWA|nr:hypothetical protein NDU88_006013 [Pleurodeles waltl]